MCFWYLLAFVLVIVAAGLAIYQQAYPQRPLWSPNSGPAAKPFPWQATRLRGPFDWSRMAWRMITWGGFISFSFAALIAAVFQQGVSLEQGSMTRLALGVVLLLASCAGIGEVYFHLLRSPVSKARANCAALAGTWMVVPPMLLTGSFIALWDDIPAYSPPVRSPSYQVTEITRTGPFTEVETYETNPGQVDGLVRILVGVIAFSCLAVLGIAWLGLACVPLIYVTRGAPLELE